MAKYKKNIIQSRDEYTRYYSGFRGVDFNSDAADVDATRMAYAKNVYRDWHSEQGGAIETVPGYRKLYELGGEKSANGLHHWQTSDGSHRVAVHHGDALHVFDHGDRDSLDLRATHNGLNDHHSVSFLHHNRLYILDGKNYMRMDEQNEYRELTHVKDSAYIPISYADGEPYEQRNMLTDRFINRYNLVNLSDYLVESRGAFTFEYDADTLTATVTGFAPEATLEEQKILVLPESTIHEGKTYTVTAVDEYGFINNPTIERVYISRTIESIGSGAFSGCNSLNYVDTGYSTTVTGESEIKQNSLKNIGSSAFSNCPKLYMVCLFTNATELTVGAGAFSGGDGDHGNYTYNTNAKYFVLGSNVKGAKPASSELANIYSNLPFISKDKSLSINLFYLGGKTTDTNNSLYYVQKAIQEKVQIGEGTVSGTVYENVEIAAYEYNGSFSTASIPYEKNCTVAAQAGGAIYSSSGGHVTLSGPSCIVLRREVDGQVRNGAIICFYNLDREIGTLEYRFTIYDPCLELKDLTVDGASILDNPNYLVSTDPNSEGYIGHVLVNIATRDLLPEGAVLEIHGRGVEGKFRTVKNYVNAIDGNSDYKGTAVEAICGCTICASFDGRIFLSGNPNLPNTVFYSQRDLTGYNNPEYFGVLNFINDGVSNSPVVAMMATSSVLCVLKGDTVQEGSIYYHTGADTGDDIVPRIYPSTQGLAGLGCLGACCNFYDDPVFISRRGLEAVGKEQVNLERSIEHRSFNVDVKLTAEDLKTARMAEWLGYLVILVGGRIYLADSRQIFTHKTGVANYEWYYVDPVGVWNSDRERYFTLTEDTTVRGTDGVYYKLSELYVDQWGRNKFYFDTDRRYVDDGSYVTKDAWVVEDTGGMTMSRAVTRIKCIQDEESHYIPVDTVGERAGGTFVPATEILCVEDVLYMLAGDTLLCFNTDKRGKSVDINGEEVEVDPDAIHRSYYTFCGHRYESGFSTKSDNCDIPHLTKQTRRNSFVIRVKSMGGSRIKARGKAERGEYSEWVELSATSNDFDTSAIAFDNFTTIGRDTHMCILREMFRKWYEKQIYFYSDEYQAPIGIYTAAFRYSIQGRIRV